VSQLPSEPLVCQYFVDEAGDPTLFSGKGKILIGQEGCSYYFMMGVLQVPDPQSLSRELEALRHDLLADPYFRRVPSMQPEQRKTSVMFHAKDDCPEVRREVFALLMRYPNLQFFAVIRDKGRGVLREVGTYVHKWYKPNDQYDSLVKRLFKDRLHKADQYEITFATRGAKDRTRALQTALDEARKRFEEKWDIRSEAPIQIHNQPASQSPCLQAADYMLWALQRCYEKREDRYLDYVWPLCHLVHDVDDHRVSKTGVYYNQRNPIILSALPDLWVPV
jgi:hypothetical protein